MQQSLGDVGPDESRPARDEYLLVSHVGRYDNGGFLRHLIVRRFGRFFVGIVMKTNGRFDVLDGTRRSGGGVIVVAAVFIEMSEGGERFRVTKLHNDAIDSATLVIVMVR
jgi:hypothetical protein